MAGRSEKSWSFNYEDLQELTGKDLAAVHQAASRGMRGVASGFNPGDFRSVVLWIFRNATDDLKIDIMTEMNFFRRGAKERLQDRLREKGNKRSPKSPRK